MMQIDMVRLLKEGDEMERVMRLQPRCYACGHEQVQLLDYREQKWRCRICKHRFETNV